MKLPWPLIFPEREASEEGSDRLALEGQEQLHSTRAGGWLFDSVGGACGYASRAQGEAAGGGGLAGQP